MNKPFIPKRFLGAFKCGHRASAREFIDESLSYKLLKIIIASKYSDQQSILELDFITKFNNEYHKAVIKKGDKSAMHRSKYMRQERYGANNARNRDVLSVDRKSCLPLQSFNLKPNPDNLHSDTHLIPLSDIYNKRHENTVISLLDYKKSARLQKKYKL